MHTRCAIWAFADEPNSAGLKLRSGGLGAVILCCCGRCGATDNVHFFHAQNEAGRSGTAEVADLGSLRAKPIVHARSASRSVAVPHITCLLALTFSLPSRKDVPQRSPRDQAQGLWEPTCHSTISSGRWSTAAGIWLQRWKLWNLGWWEGTRTGFWFIHGRWRADHATKHQAHNHVGIHASHAVFPAAA